MTIASNKNTPRNTYTATAGQTVFNIGFEFFNVNDIKVYKNGTLLTYNASPSTSSQYKVTGTASSSDDAYEFGSGGTITLGAGATLNDSIVIIRDIAIERLSDFPTSGSFDITSLNTQLDTLVSMMSEQDTLNSRSVRLADTDVDSATVTLPNVTTRASKVMAFDASGNIVTNISSSGLSTLSTITADITTVAGIAADVSQVASDSADVQTVATNIASINIVSTNIADVITVANDLNEAISEVETVANDLNEAVSEIDTVGNNITFVQTVGDATNIANITTVAGQISPTNNISTLAGLNAEISALYNIRTDITQVSTDSADVQTVAADLSGANNIGTVATDLAGSNNIGTVASNISGVNSFADRYRVASSDPATSLDAGDLVYNTSANALKYYNGSTWEAIVAGGLTDIVQDGTPQLGGNLDVNGNSIVSVSNGDIAITPDGTGKVVLDGLNYPTADGTSGQAIVTDGSGNLSFSTTSSPEVYGFNKNASGELIVTTTNQGADNIDSATFAGFNDVLFSASGFTFSISNGDLIATI